jgi:hypothetical protein
VPLVGLARNASDTATGRQGTECRCWRVIKKPRCLMRPYSLAGHLRGLERSPRDALLHMIVQRIVSSRFGP